MKKTLVYLVALIILATAAVIAFLPSKPAQTPGRQGSSEAAPKTQANVAPTKAPSKTSKTPQTAQTGQTQDDAAAEEEETPKTPEELKEEAEEALVTAFDDLTDRWMEPAEKGVKMTDVDAFVAQFKKLPAERKEECLQRALNLVPDENVMLLAGILMDKTQPKEYAELVFNDVLNRDENVKKPILEQIYKDKSHPCWADTAWILDVTGEKDK